MKAFTYALAILSLFLSTVSHAVLLNIAPESVEAKAWIIFDPQSGQVLAEHNSHIQRAPASMTKMMVAYITLKEIAAGRLSKQEILTTTPVVNMVQWDESQMHLKPGEQISIDQLLAGLIVMSANDAAVTLAERISGSVPAFVKRMNAEAKALGMKDTHFSNPAGITMPDHVSSAYDMALLGQAVTSHTKDYLHYSVMPNFHYKQLFHKATNLALKFDPSVDGLKTGFTHAAGYNLALTAHRPSADLSLPERRLIVVVMGTKNAAKRAEIAHDLLDLAYSYTRNEMVVKDKQVIAELPVLKSTLKMFKVESNQAKFVTTSLYNQNTPIDLHQYDRSKQRLMLPHNGQIIALEPLAQTKTNLTVQLNEQKLIAPLAQVMPLASIYVYQNNTLLKTINIEQEVNIVKANLYQRFIMWLSHLFSMSTHNPSQVKIYPLQS